MKRFSTVMLFTALAALLYVNLGDLARISIGLAQAKLNAANKLLIGRDLVQLTIPIKDIESGEAFFPGKKEVRYHGKLYDIFDQKKDGDKLVLQVIEDEDEDGFLSELKEHINGWFNTAQKNTDKKQSLKHTKLLKHFLPEERSIFSLTILPVNAFNISILSLPEFPFKQVIKGPPKLG